jgi:hypothetical protein
MLNKSSNNRTKKLNKSTSINSNNEQEKKIKKEQKRSFIILDLLYENIDKARLDPILDVFKNNELLKEFYMKRILEIIKVK